MTFYSLFSPSVAALRGHSFAFQTISDNIVNSTTPGFKRADTRFQEVVNLAGAVHNPSSSAQYGFGGMYGANQHFLSAQGLLVGTQRALDVAVNGQGFLITNADQGGGGEFQFTRAGQLALRVVDTETYIVDSAGNFVFGWPANGTGGFNTGPSLNSTQAMRVDRDAFTFNSAATTNAAFYANLPASDAVGATPRIASLGILDGSNTEHVMTLSFAKTAANTWEVTPSFAGGSTVTSGVPITMTFDATGILVAPANQNIDIQFPDTTTTSVDVDFSGMSQFAGSFTLTNLDRDGNLQGQLHSVAITRDGVVEGLFTNGLSQPLYKLPLATFRNPNMLSARSDTHFAQSAESGELRLYEANLTERGDFIPGAVEDSNVSMDMEFTKMIITQQAYNSSAQVIRTVDEMMRVASDLKR